jgi:ubiquinone/menaquinone biosynthesis C-methylase UbiE
LLKRLDLIVSNELFCDLKADLKQALKEFYRILKHGGQMIHAELSPVPENEAQRLLIEANLHYSSETVLPESSCWFSPTVDHVAALMHRIGFRDIQVRFFETDLRLVYEVAVEQLRQWRIDERFMKKYKKDLQEHGIEFPPRTCYLLREGRSLNLLHKDLAVDHVQL